MLVKFRAAFVQGQFNQGMADILAYEVTALTFIGAGIFWYLWGWQWFFWGMVLIPVSLCVGLFIPIVADFILIGLAVCWALPFIFMANMGIDAGWVLAIIAFLLSFWVHWKGMSWYIDLDRS